MATRSAAAKAKLRLLAIGHFELGQIYASEDNPVEAMDEFDNAIELDGTYCPPRFEKIKKFLRNDDPRNALV